MTTVAEIENVLHVVGIGKHFENDDHETKELWLIEALRHTLSLLDVAKVAVNSLVQEWKELDE